MIGGKKVKDISILPRVAESQHCLPFEPTSLPPVTDASLAGFLLKPSLWPGLSWLAVPLPGNRETGNKANR
jgi:hypothetical protein